MIDKELVKELAKNKADEIIAKQELDSAKNKFIEEVNNGFDKEIIKMNLNELNKPIKIKRPFGYKVKQFFKRINKVIGG